MDKVDYLSVLTSESNGVPPRVTEYLRETNINKMYMHLNGVTQPVESRQVRI